MEQYLDINGVEVLSDHIKAKQDELTPSDGINIQRNDETGNLEISALFASDGVEYSYEWDRDTKSIKQTNNYDDEVQSMMLSGVAMVSDLPDMSLYATKNELSSYASTSSLSDYATIASLSNYATKQDISGMATSATISDIQTRLSDLENEMQYKAETSAIPSATTEEEIDEIISEVFGNS